MGVVVAYEIIDHGIDGSSYFPGCGTSFSNYNSVFTGAGDNPREALEDAIDQAASSGWQNLDIITEKLPLRPSIAKEIEKHIEDCKQKAYMDWQEEQEESGKVHIDEATEEQIEKGLTYDPDDCPVSSDDNPDEYMEDCYYYVSLRVRDYDHRIDSPEIAEKSRLWGRLDDLSTELHNAKVSGKKEEYEALDAEKKSIERRLEELSDIDPHY